MGKGGGAGRRREGEREWNGDEDRRRVGERDVDRRAGEEVGMERACERARKRERRAPAEERETAGGARGGTRPSEAERNERKFRHHITPTRPRIAGSCGWRLNTSSGVRASVRYIGRPAAQGLSA